MGGAERRVVQGLVGTRRGMRRRAGRRDAGGRRFESWGEAKARDGDGPQRRGPLRGAGASGRVWREEPAWKTSRETR